MTRDCMLNTAAGLKGAVIDGYEKGQQRTRMGIAFEVEIELVDMDSCTLASSFLLRFVQTWICWMAKTPFVSTAPVKVVP